VHGLRQYPAFESFCSVVKSLNLCSRPVWRMMLPGSGPGVLSRTGFSLSVFIYTGKFKIDRRKPALPAAVQSPVESQESGIGQHGENHQDQDERHDRGNVTQVNGVHQEKTDALLRGEKFSEDRT
jgi:hypothetical protein